MEVIKKWVGHGSEEMIRRDPHLRPDFMRDELARVLGPAIGPEDHPAAVVFHDHGIASVRLVGPL